MEFSYMLQGFSDEWSDWSIERYKDFTSLHEGSYTILVKARNVYGLESEPASFVFRVMPPWQRSTTAWLVYLLMFIGLVFLIIRYVLHRVRQSVLRQEEKGRQEMQERERRYEREALVAEKEIVKLQNEKLQNEVVFRDKELSNQTMGIINKNKFLKKVYEDLNSIQEYVVNDAARAKIFGVTKRIKKEIDLKHQNKIFESYFDEANEEFFKRLKEKYPDLTPNDLRLCAFIRMNISTKEIAAILNISYRGAEVSRYRLRKKMDLPRETNLASHLAGF
jgi:DNA-binding CsgD family transcriptional regulator